MNKTVYLFCGPPGGGKTTIAKSMMLDIPFGGETAYISRDEIRFELLKEGEDYFAHEDEVFNTFVDRINHALGSDCCANIFIDATHLSEKSRNKTLDRLHLAEDTILIPVSVRPPLERCLEQNALRSGLARVPETAIRNMYASYKEPTYKEKYNYHYIIHKG